MALDGLLISKLLKEFDYLINGKIQKISQVGNNDFLFVIRNHQNYRLFLSLDRNQYRLCLTEKEYINPANATMFTMFLRKHLEGGIIKGIYQHDLDRIITIEVNKINEFGDNKTKKIIIELMGKNSNLIITDAENIIIDAFRKIGISETGRTIMPKALYEYPEVTKINIFKDNDENINNKLQISLNKHQEIVANFSGFSPLIAKYIINHKAPLTVIEEIKNNKIIPSTFKIGDKEDFYFFNLGEITASYQSISEMLESYFYQKTIQLQVQEKSQNLSTHINHTINKLKNKIIKLEDELKVANDAEKYKQYGELIMSNLYQLPNKNIDKITLFDYYNNQDVTIELDDSINIKANANKFFTKYQKSKKAKAYITEQISLASDEIEYLELISVQIKNANVKDIEEIKNELIANHYLKSSSNKDNKKKKEKIEVLTYYTSENTPIYVGKNNLQNEYLTHQFAKPNDTWMHVKDGPGSHVIIHKDGELTEEDIRTGALLAAYYSKYQDSSSVAVDYTKIKNIKKIPGKRNCFVTYTNQKTIYIDPDITLIDKLQKKR